MPQIAPFSSADSISTPLSPEATASQDVSRGNEAVMLWLGAALLLGAFVWLYLPTFRWLAQSWGSDEYYAHGPLLPFISVYLIWQKRPQLAGLWRDRPQRGLVLSGFIPLALLMQLLGTLVDMNIVRALQAFSIPLLLLGIARYLGGRSFERELRFPLFFLCLAVPLSGPMVEILTVPLQNYAASGSAMLLGLLGMPIERVGVNLYTPLYHFVVAVPCSGLKTAITLFTMGVLICHLLPRLTQSQRVALCALSIPISLIANTLRVMAIVWLGFHYGTEAAEGFLHNWSGLFMFMISMGSLIGAGTFLDKTRGHSPTVASRAETA